MAKEQFQNIHGNVIETPGWLFDRMNEEFGFVYDLAATKENAKCDHFFTDVDNSLGQPWHKIDGWCWLNPPYSPLKPWVTKAQQENKLGAKIVILMPNVFATKYFSSYLPTEIRIIVGRINFLKDGVEMKGNMTDVSLIVYDYPNDNQPKVRWINRDLLKECASDL